eukprot:1147973-Prymnesium_polylepis.1
MLSADAYGDPCGAMRRHAAPCGAMRGENYLHAGGEALPASRAECDGNASCHGAAAAVLRSALRGTQHRTQNFTFDATRASGARRRECGARRAGACLSLAAAESEGRGKLDVPRSSRLDLQHGVE